MVVTYIISNIQTISLLSSDMVNIGHHHHFCYFRPSIINSYLLNILPKVKIRDERLSIQTFNLKCMILYGHISVHVVLCQNWGLFSHRLTALGETVGLSVERLSISLADLVFRQIFSVL